MCRILVAMDGSDCAMRALRFALRQARAMPPSRMHVLAVRPPVISYGELEVYGGEPRMRELAAQHTGAALDDATGVLRGQGVDFNLEQIEGEPATTIARRATELDCDWIVMGTHGRGRLGTAFMGSVAQHVVKVATVPVTLVK